MRVLREIQAERGLATLIFDSGEPLVVREADLRALPARVGEEIDVFEYESRMAARQLAGAYEAALCMLDRSAKTARQVLLGLRKKGFVAAAAEAAVERLKELRYLDDRQYAARMVEAAERSGAGAYALKGKLRAKGLSEEDVEAALDALPEEQQIAAARAMAQKLAPKYAGEPPHKARAKLAQALARRGFSWDAIRAALEDADDFDQ